MKNRRIKKVGDFAGWNWIEKRDDDDDDAWFVFVPSLVLSFSKIQHEKRFSFAPCFSLNVRVCVYVLSNFGLFEFSATRVNLCGAVLNLMCTILSSNLFVTIATVFRTSCEFAKIPNLLKRMVVFDHAQTIGKFKIWSIFFKLLEKVEFCNFTPWLCYFATLAYSLQAHAIWFQSQSWKFSPIYAVRLAAYERIYEAALLHIANYKNDIN